MHVIFWSSTTSDFRISKRYIGPYKLAHWLRKHDYNCQVIDFIQTHQNKSITSEELVELTEKFITNDTMMIGVSTTFSMSLNTQDSLPKSMAQAQQIIQQKYPKIKFVLGGSRVEFCSPAITSNFNCAIVGFAEDIILDLLSFYQTGKNEPFGVVELPHKIKFYRQPINKKFNIQNCDFQWHKNDCIQPNETLPIEISRGCMFKCKFCAYPLLGRGKYDYVRDMDHIRNEILNNYNKWNVTNYYILDDTFNDTTRKISSFQESVSSLPFKIKFTCYLRADLLDHYRDTVYQLKDAGLAGAHFGIETFNTTASALIGKAWSGKSAKKFIPWVFHDAWKDEVAPFLSFIAGLPGDTPEEILESAEWLKENDIRYWVWKVLSVRKYSNEQYTSEFSKNADKYGYLFTDDSDRYYWENPKYNWTLTSAREVVKELNRRASDFPLTFGSWNSLTLLTYNYDFNDILQTPRKDFLKELPEKDDAWQKNYFNDLRKL